MSDEIDPNVQRNFEQAFQHMKNGGLARLPYWSPEVNIKIQVPDRNSKMTHPYLYVNSKYGLVPWTPTQVELFSEQWVLI